jgi:hypothetical protein
MSEASQTPGAGRLSTLQAGSKERFTLIKELGRGGMGVVWLAEDTRLGEKVALKFLPAEIRADPVALDGLRRETARSHKLSHPNIIRIHDLHEESGGPAFISMEYVDGPTLSVLRLEQPARVLSWETLRPLVEQLCAALDYAHAERVIHRDLKPGNIILDCKGRLKLADFGIAAVVSDSMSRVTAPRTSGTLAYMSPQQLAGKRPTAADDLYALGATLYELLTSKPPFYTGDIAHQVLYELPEAPDERLITLGIENPIPPAVAAMIMACLAKDPASRPPSVRAVAEWIGLELDAANRLQGESLLGPKVRLASAPATGKAGRSAQAGARCPFCAQPVPSGAVLCGHCGKALVQAALPGWKRWSIHGFHVLGGALSGAAVGIAGSPFVNSSSGFAWPSRSTVITAAIVGALLGGIVGYLNARRRVRLAEAQETMLGLHRALTQGRAPSENDEAAP